MFVNFLANCLQKLCKERDGAQVQGKGSHFHDCGRSMVDHAFAEQQCAVRVHVLQWRASKVVHEGCRVSCTPKLFGLPKQTLQGRGGKGAQGFAAQWRSASSSGGEPLQKPFKLFLNVSVDFDWCYLLTFVIDDVEKTTKESRWGWQRQRRWQERTCRGRGGRGGANQKGQRNREQEAEVEDEAEEEEETEEEEDSEWRLECGC